MYDLLEDYQVHCFDCLLRVYMLGDEVPRSSRGYTKNFYIFSYRDDQNPVVHIVKNGVYADTQPLYIFKSEGYPVYDGYGELTLAETREDMEELFRDNNEMDREFNRLYREMGLIALFDQCRTHPECFEELRTKTEAIHNCTHRVFREKWYAAGDDVSKIVPGLNHAAVD